VVATNIEVGETEGVIGEIGINHVIIGISIKEIIIKTITEEKIEEVVINKKETMDLGEMVLAFNKNLSTQTLFKIQTPDFTTKK